MPLQDDEISSSPVADTAHPQFLSFVSPDFDALKALQTKNLQPPDRAVQPLSNLDACRKFVPEANASDGEALPAMDREASLSGLQLVENNDECHENRSQELFSLRGCLPVHASSTSQITDAVDLQGDCEDRLSLASLDFFSPEFDALEALCTKGLVPPNSKVRPLDNLNRCRWILPQEVPQSIVNTPLQAPRSLESILAQERAKACKSLKLQKAAECARKVKIFDILAEKLKHGPLGLLTECYYKKLKVKVWTRHSHGVRGSLTGFLRAFDQHFNMVLHDIDEEYAVRRQIPRLVHRHGRSIGFQTNADSNDENHDRSMNPSKSSGTESSIMTEVEEITTQLKELRLFPKLEHRRRHLNQVFLRGDSVVMVQKLE